MWRRTFFLTALIWTSMAGAQKISDGEVGIRRTMEIVWRDGLILRHYFVPNSLMFYDISLRPDLSWTSEDRTRLRQTVPADTMSDFLQTDEYDAPNHSLQMELSLGTRIYQRRYLSVFGIVYLLGAYNWSENRSQKGVGLWSESKKGGVGVGMIPRWEWGRIALETRLSFQVSATLSETHDNSFYAPLNTTSAHHSETVTTTAGFDRSILSLDGGLGFGFSF